ncbi:hypothetical protein D805_0631 [Bifidobacterium thermophilum RBL67]|uniref:Uncharacterized protein n=1 Tax=Bifidobacterium thermophilum RBL67 TaxID=1254439 RepID=M4REA8_9BIFI|nr:hypothetical protein D805_0631 [Bifidobacterium thermophilum RBL67]
MADAEFQLTLPMRGAIDELTEARGGDDISTHAPHAGSDFGFCHTFCVYRQFQLTLPMRGAIVIDQGVSDTLIFQLTLPMRGAMLV